MEQQKSKELTSQKSGPSRVNEHFTEALSASLPCLRVRILPLLWIDVRSRLLRGAQNGAAYFDRIVFFRLMKLNEPITELNLA